VWFKKWRAVAKVGDVAPGGVIPVTVDGIELALGRDGDRYFATQRACMHSGGDLSAGRISRGHLVCPRHGWEFSTEDGRLTAIQGYCLAVYAVRVKGDQIEVDPVPRTRTRRPGQP
jgi:3-phenylpropionate/trans-cinnamate dioxygenase ferredoxin subunit